MTFVFKVTQGHQMSRHQILLPTNHSFPIASLQNFQRSCDGLLSTTELGHQRSPLDLKGHIKVKPEFRCHIGSMQSYRRDNFSGIVYGKLLLAHSSVKTCLCKILCMFTWLKYFTHYCTWWGILYLTGTCSSLMQYVYSLLMNHCHYAWHRTLSEPLYINNCINC